MFFVLFIVFLVFMYMLCFKLHFSSPQFTCNSVQSFNSVHLNRGLLSLQSLVLQRRLSLFSAIYTLAGFVLQCWNHHVFFSQPVIQSAAVWQISIIKIFRISYSFLSEMYVSLTYSHPFSSAFFFFNMNRKRQQSLGFYVFE